jgi:hypothetical protein
MLVKILNYNNEIYTHTVYKDFMILKKLNYQIEITT